MNIEKAQVKIGTANELGARIEDVLEAAKAEALRADGGAAACVASAKDIEGLMAHVKRDIDDGKFDLQVAAIVNRYLERAAQLCVNRSIMNSNAMISANGQAQALVKVVTIVSKFKVDEETKVANFMAALAKAEELKARTGEGTPADLDLGRPDASIKDQRLGAGSMSPPAPASSSPKAPLSVQRRIPPRKRGR